VFHFVTPSHPRNNGRRRKPLNTFPWLKDQERETDKGPQNLPVRVNQKLILEQQTRKYGESERRGGKRLSNGFMSSQKVLKMIMRISRES